MSKRLYRFARTGSFAFVMLLASTATAFAQVQISGVVTDGDTGEPLPGANVVIYGTTQGSAADAEGRFTISGVANGTYNLVASFVGYDDQTRVVSVRGSNVVVNFELAFANQSLQALEVFASRAVERETPVAATTVDKVQVQTRLGSRDIPLVLDTAPSVYTTMEGGGAGDARINVRGFDQRNVAIMINGVPVNDMENGWVYWSNWDGVGDATSSIQLQRGLSAVNLATPSIGGTLNIITDPTAMRRGLMVKQEVGNGAFFKTTAVLSTGLVDGKYGLTVAGVRKTGDGITDYTFTDAWAYYVAASYNVNAKNRLDFFALGAPQKHGQNLYAQNIGAYDQEFASGLKYYDTDAFSKYNEVGRDFNQNGATVRGYSGQQAVGDNTFDRHDPGFLMERENFYHKPQVNLNWYSQLTDKALLSTVVYYSGGQGGGTGTLGSSIRRTGFDELEPWYANAPYTINWDETIERNVNNDDGSRTIIRNSRNNQDTFGAISKIKLELTEPLSFEFGVDWRTAEIEHYREVRDLLGGDYFRCDEDNDCGFSDFWEGDDEIRGLGDKVDYNFTNTVDWLGAFAQAEYKVEGFTAYGMAGLSTIKYGYTNHFVANDAGGELTAETDNINGVQVKGGALLKVSPTVDLYTNLGYVSKVPIFDGVIDDRAGLENPDPENEKFYSFEGGAFWEPATFLRMKFNVYSTRWENRTLTQDDREDFVDGLFILRGLDALHQGIEMEVAYQPIQEMRLDLAASFNDWTYTDDVSGSYRPDRSSTELIDYEYFVKDLKVGDAPQTQIAAALSLYPVDGLMVQGVLKHFANHYAEFNPYSRNDPNDRFQSWLTPQYQVFDLHASYDLPIESLPFDLQLFGHVFNVFDTVYIQDAMDNSQYNAWDYDHDADDAEVYIGRPRTFNFGTRVTF